MNVIVLLISIFNKIIPWSYVILNVLWTVMCYNNKLREIWDRCLINASLDLRFDENLLFCWFFFTRNFIDDIFSKTPAI